jgi:hypothetical protein
VVVVASQVAFLFKLTRYSIDPRSISLSLSLSLSFSTIHGQTLTTIPHIPPPRKNSPHSFHRIMLTHTGDPSHGIISSPSSSPSATTSSSTTSPDCPSLLLFLLLLSLHVFRFRLKLKHLRALLAFFGLAVHLLLLCFLSLLLCFFFFP